MATGDAARVRLYVADLARNARAAGDRTLNLLVGDVVGQAQLIERIAPVDVVTQALGTRVLQEEAGLRFVSSTGYRKEAVFRFAVVPS